MWNFRNINSSVWWACCEADNSLSGIKGSKETGKRCDGGRSGRSRINRTYELVSPERWLSTWVIAEELSLDREAVKEGQWLLEMKFDTSSTTQKQNIRICSGSLKLTKSPLRLKKESVFQTQVNSCDMIRKH